MNSDEIRRLYYYNRQYLGFKDFRDEQQYHIDMRRRHNIAHHTWGIVAGLELERKETFQGSGIYETFVKPGMAVDGFGREIVVFSSVPLDTIKVGDQVAGATLPARLKVWIAYDVEKADPPKPGYEVCDAGDQFMRIRETYKLIYSDAPAFKGRNHDDRQTWPQASEELPDDPVSTPWPVYVGTVVWNTNPQNPSQKVIANIEIFDSRDDKRRHYVGADISGTLALGPSGNEIIRGDDPGTKNPDTGQPNNGLLIQSAQTVEVNIDSNDNPSNMFVVTKGSNRSELLRVQEDGNVGIGTTESNDMLHLKAENGNIGLRIESGDGNSDRSAIRFYGKDDQKAWIATQNDTGRLYIGNPKQNDVLNVVDGNVGIGTTSPDAELHVIGNILGAAKGPVGEAFRITVGNTPQSNTNWIQYDANGIYVDIDTSGAGFSKAPYYFTSIGGNSTHWATQGATSIYSPTATNFRVYVYRQGITVSQAKNFKWHINWIGIGN